jgi:hypothetical protein
VIQTSKVPIPQVYEVVLDVSLCSSHFSSTILACNRDLLRVSQGVDGFVGAADHSFNYSPLLNYD